MSIEEIRLVIFDLDGTLYSLSRLRRLIVRDLLLYYGLRPQRWQELRWVQQFRALREALADQPHTQLAQLQYQLVARQVGGKPTDIQRVVEEWMLHRPLPYLQQLVYPEAKAIFEQLRQRKIAIAILSDFPAALKMEAMGLQADYVLDATMPEIDQLKPEPHGLQYLLRRSGLHAGQCLFVGDRDDRDGEAARRAGMAYWILPESERPLAGLLENWQKGTI